METEGIVLSKLGGVYRVYVGGVVHEATLRGRLKRGANRILVGDRVTLLHHENGPITIERLVGRRNVLQRRSPGRAGGKRAVAANVDQVVVVGAARRPDWDPRLIDRFVAVAEANDLPVVVVVNKCDLHDDATTLVEPYRVAGYPILLTSVPERGGLDQLNEVLGGRVSLFTGTTGVGKSSLLNALRPGLALRTAPVSVRSGAGRHTTVAAEMHPLGEGGFVVDTPGLRDVSLWGLKPSEVEIAFPEFSAYATACRFDDCRHMKEPDCAVVAAAERGDIHTTRLESYRALLAEVSDAVRPWSSRRH